MSQVPASPERRFASDNNAGVHPRVLEAIAAANSGHATAYGDDRWTRRAESVFRDLFGSSVETFMVWGGTGANVMALATMLSPAGAVLCTDAAHINVDETGAPERVLGAKLIDVPHDRGRLHPEQIREFAHFTGVMHHVQPSVLSITQSTEWGTLYTPDEVGALCDTAHSMGMTVHLDGARIANATAALGGSVEALRAFTIDAGVDVVSFGGAKNGMMHGEAVVYLNTALARSAPYVRKQVTQLPSKVRYISAQFVALLEDELWIENASHANRMATRLYGAGLCRPRSRTLRPAGGQQPVPGPARRSARGPSWLVVLLRLERPRPSGPLDDLLGHDRRRYRRLRPGCRPLPGLIPSRRHPLPQPAGFDSSDLTHVTKSLIDRPVSYP
ncbi:MAG: threonine aldolase family protein [Actinomycetota bacterium]